MELYLVGLVLGIVLVITEPQTGTFYLLFLGTAMMVRDCTRGGGAARAPRA